MRRLAAVNMSVVVQVPVKLSGEREKQARVAGRGDEPVEGWWGEEQSL